MNWRRCSRRTPPILSLQNGVENAATIARHVRQAVVPAVVYVATAMGGPGLVRHFGRGDLVIGALNPEARRDAAVDSLLHDLVALFGDARVNVTISADVIAELWSKLLVNCAYNAISALAQAPYAKLAAQPEVREVQIAIVREVIALARRRRRRAAVRATRCRRWSGSPPRCPRSSPRPRRTWHAANRRRSIT